MAGALQLLATLQARQVPPVPSSESMGEPLEPAPAVAVPPVPPVPSPNHQPQVDKPPTGQSQEGGSRDLHFREKWGNRGNLPKGQAEQPPAPPEPRRTAWRILRDGRPICCMVGEPMTHAEALAAARWRWPDAEVATD